MKLLIAIALMLGLTASGVTRGDSLAADEISLTARSIDSEGNLKTLRGNVRVETSTVIVRADQATYNTSTRDLEAAGNVRITFKK